MGGQKKDRNLCTSFEALYSYQCFLLSGSVGCEVLQNFHIISMCCIIPINFQNTLPWM